MSFKDAPTVDTLGDFLNLKKFEGKTIVVRVGNRRTFNTRYGENPAVFVSILTTAGDVDSGWVFSAQFLAMESGENYAGELRRDGLRWVLAPIGEKQKKQMESVLKNLKVRSGSSLEVSDDDVPF
jgi:hypothetical protein